jgi:phosphatidyl-myo-inositol dimannoside synthase
MHNPKSAGASSTVYIITHEFFPTRGGIATFTEEMAKASQELGWEVEVWAQNLGDAIEPVWPFRIWRLPLKGTHDFSCQLRLAFHLISRRRELRRATVYLPEPGPMLTLMLLQRFHAFRPRNLILTFHGSEILKFYHNPLIRPLARRLIGNATKISTLTSYTRELLLSHFPAAEEKLIKTPGALRSGYAATDRAAETQSERIVILTVGRIHPRKGQLITLQALLALPPKIRSRIEYRIAGASSRPKYEARLRAVAATADFPVVFLGDSSDEALSGFYDDADIFAMTSVEHGKSVEGFGLVYLEASAHGLPIVAHAVGGVPEAVVANETGLLAPPHDRPALIAAFAKLISSKSMRRRLGEKGREWARRATWGDSAQILFGSPPTEN